MCHFLFFIFTILFWLRFSHFLFSLSRKLPTKIYSHLSRLSRKKSYFNTQAYKVLILFWSLLLHLPRFFPLHVLCTPYFNTVCYWPYLHRLCVSIVFMCKHEECASTCILYHYWKWMLYGKKLRKKTVIKHVAFSMLSAHFSV